VKSANGFSSSSLVAQTSSLLFVAQPPPVVIPVAQVSNLPFVAQAPSLQRETPFRQDNRINRMTRPHTVAQTSDLLFVAQQTRLHPIVYSLAHGLQSPDWHFRLFGGERCLE
jgi:hypothetical protein